MSGKGRLLVVDDDVALADSVREVLESRGYETAYAQNGLDALKAVKEGSFDAVITDFQMPKMGGFELLDKLRRMRPRLPVIIMTAFGSMDRAIEATKRGAFDYLLKPFKMPSLLKMVDEAVGGQSKIPSSPTAPTTPLGKTMVGESESMQAIFKDIGRLAAKNIPVLILGETGTGKELVARALYQHSDRSHKPFVAVNCAAIPEPLIESELFGHERGAFTHAVAKRTGRFEEAHGGTLFLDEIGDLSPSTQVKLLRVLEEKRLRRVGGKEEITVDVRLLSATHRHLESMVEKGEFREDLYYRINASTLQLPPLRDRTEDMPALVDWFLTLHAQAFGIANPGVTDEALEQLRSYRWPGNVRQLDNLIKRLLIGSRTSGPISGEAVAATLLKKDQESPDPPTSDQSASSAEEPSTGATGLAQHVAARLQAASEGELDDVADVLFEDLERELFHQASVLTRGNQSKMAALLGLSRTTIREKLARYRQ